MQKKTFFVVLLMKTFYVNVLYLIAICSYIAKNDIIIINNLFFV